MFTSSYKRALFGFFVFFFGLSVMGQSVALYSKDGGRFDYPTAEIDSIVFTERQSLPLTKPDYVEAVDLGLSVRWANCNVGATKPTESGAFFAWGETSEKEIYDWDSYVDSDCTALRSSISGTLNDAAYVAWGDQWRLPSLVEMQELCDRCTWTWCDEDGVTGCRVTGPSGASIFLPAAGVRQGGTGYLSNSYGSYLSGNADATNCYYARSLVFYKDASHWIDTSLRDYGQVARAVCS